MKVEKFAVSVQHGKGPHYFIRFDLKTKEEAFNSAALTKKYKTAAYKKGARPSVYIWQLVEQEGEAEAPVILKGL